ncbi:MAG: 5'/3'-nucleotidase SurE, partial [Bacteroidales bacterium]
LVVAPDSPRSGQSHAVTLNTPLRLSKYKQEKGVDYYICNGTPTDCVKLGIKVILKNHLPDLLLSGINHGSNSSTNAIYSGTMAAVVEGAMIGLPSVGFSLLDSSSHADFLPSLPYIEHLIKKAISVSMEQKKEWVAETMQVRGQDSNSLPKSPFLCWNVNIPKVSAPHIKGIKVCRQADAVWEEDALERVDPTGEKYYWLEGRFNNTDKGEDTDLYFLSQGYISLVPTTFDWTDYALLSPLAFLNACKDEII